MAVQVLFQKKPILDFCEYIGYCHFSHLKTLEIAGIENVIVIQNKIDLVTREEALENFKEIQEFLSTTPYKDSTVIPISAQYSANVSVLLEEILKVT